MSKVYFTLAALSFLLVNVEASAKGHWFTSKTALSHNPTTVAPYQATHVCPMVCKKHGGWVTTKTNNVRVNTKKNDAISCLCATK